ncbi:hypothetical protein [Plastoroseomonas hellenica]|uniref:5-bromo-4-chloroindolyl phosphate hydrolysis protein n=1 Tax=Plastoroseomonas hellenica TaxID=2687306 RepID=A0ABS5EUW2_9PROT|nr:hypothetical protein [Plastoroseomonas hellenica]MBR0643933.1 hypothetical protein [Plastoroseomonas hellenica]MBR0664069.1 hypothetical protein [Plastoroseomonas hellenica]
MSRSEGWGGTLQRWRDGVRGLGLPIFVAPLWLDLVIEIFRGRPHRITGAALGIGLVFLAVMRLRRGRAGDIRRAAVLAGVAAGLTAGMAAGLGPAGIIFGFGAWAGMRLLYDGSFQEVAPPAPPPEPEPPPPAPPPEQLLIADAAARLTRLRDAAARLPEPRLARVADAMGGVLDDLRARPDRLPLARRFLNVHLDGLDRIQERLVAGAEPPAALGPLFEELERQAGELRAHLRAEESAALEVQVKVLSDRLREEGYR